MNSRLFNDIVPTAEIRRAVRKIRGLAAMRRCYAEREREGEA
jgi:hypothetical protein